MPRFPLLACLLALASRQVGAQDWIYTTGAGDTPLAIARTYLERPDRWRDLLRLNHVPDARALPAGRALRIPVAWLKAGPSHVLVSHAAGDVQLHRADGHAVVLAAGHAVRGGETVVTGPDGYATFRLVDGTRVALAPASRLCFETLIAYGETGMAASDLQLEAGRVEVGANKQLPPVGGLRVRTPIALAGLRGTTFRLSVSEDGQQVRNEVLQGQVSMHAETREVMVSAVHGTLVERGAPPAPPIALLPAPDLGALPDRLREPPVRFAWPAQAGAQRWRARIASDPDFQQVIFDQTVEDPVLQWQPLPVDGPYYLQVRAIDPLGLEGMPAVHGFVLDVQPLAPQLEAPEDAERSDRESLSFAWAAAPEAAGYLLQIAPTPDFTPDRTLERRLGPLLRHTEPLPRGLYFWRMASLDGEGHGHGWGEIRQARVHPLPAPPRGEARSEGAHALFGWTTSPGAHAYELEVSRRTDFATVEARVRESGTRTTLPLRSGKYAWRLRAVQADGQAGPWSRAGSLVMPPDAPHDIRVQVDAGRLTVQWAGMAPAFRLEFARDPAFAQPLFNHKEAGNVTRLLTPEPGQYWVRVIALSETGAYGNRSRAVPFTVRSWQ
ncbi:MAG: FecR domain-containing protein [Pseudomonadota bacterium]